MPPTDAEKQELEVFQWPYINPNVLSDFDQQRLRETFKKMVNEKSKATVIDILDFIEEKHATDRGLKDWTRQRITKLLSEYFPPC